MAGQSKEEPTGSGTPQLVGLFSAGAGFFLVFASWGLMENLISTYYAKLGYYSMALVYFGIGPGALIAPAIIAKTGPKLGMACATLTYTLYSVAHLLMEYGIGQGGQLLLPAGVGVGLTCSTLWTSLGVYVKNLSQAYDKAKGLDSEKEGTLGIFTGFTDRAAPQLGGLTALMGSSLLLRLTGSRRLLYTLVAASLSLGNLLFFFLPKHGDTSPAEKEAARKKAEAGAKAGGEADEKSGVSVMAVPKLLWKSSTLKKIGLCYLAVGFSQSYTTGTFTADAVAQTMGPEALGMTMAVNNTMEVVAALAFGRLSDIFGRLPCYLGALALEAVNPLYFAFFPVVPGSGQRGLMMLLAACLGAGSSGCVCCLRALVGDLFEGEETGIAMSTTFLILSLSAGSGFYLGPNFGLQTKARLYACLLGLSIASSFAAVSGAKRDKEANA